MHILIMKNKEFCDIKLYRVQIVIPGKVETMHVATLAVQLSALSWSWDARLGKTDQVSLPYQGENEIMML